MILFTFLATACFITRIIDPVSRQLSLRIAPSFDAIQPDDADERIFYDWTKEEFGDNQSLIIGVSVDDFYTLENLRLFQRISDRLESLKGVDIRPFLGPAPRSEAAAKRIGSAVKGNPVYAGNLVSADSRTAAFIVYVDDTPEQVFSGC